MKISTFLIIIVFYALSLSAQVDSIKLVYPGVLTEANFMVNNSPNISYQRTLKWINESFKNPDKVLVGKEENQNVIISGYSENASYSKGMQTQYYDISYHLYISIDDSLINYKMVVDDLYYNKKTSIKGLAGFYKRSGEYKSKLMNVAKSTLETTVNNLFFSYYNKLQSTGMTSDEALAELKKAKEKLDLEIITQEEYDKIKADMMKFIK
jgi:hypothetical protein